MDGRVSFHFKSCEQGTDIPLWSLWGEEVRENQYQGEDSPNDLSATGGRAVLVPYGATPHGTKINTSFLPRFVIVASRRKSLSQVQTIVVRPPFPHGETTTIPSAWRWLTPALHTAAAPPPGTAHLSFLLALGSVDTIGSRVECARSQSWTRPSPATEAKTVEHVGDHATSLTTSHRSTDRRVCSGVVCRSSHNRTVQSALFGGGGALIWENVRGIRNRSAVSVSF